MYASVSFSRSMSASPKRPFCIERKRNKYQNVVEFQYITILLVHLHVLKACFAVAVAVHFSQPPRWYYCCWGTFSADQTVPACWWSVNHCQTWGRTFWRAATHPHTLLPPAFFSYITIDCHTDCMTWTLSTLPRAALTSMQWGYISSRLFLLSE